MRHYPGEPITEAQRRYLLQLLQVVKKPGFQAAKRMACIPVARTIEQLSKKDAAGVIGKMIYIKNRPNEFREILEKEASPPATSPASSKEKEGYVTN